MSALPKAILFDLGDTLLRETRIDLNGAISWLVGYLGDESQGRLATDLRKLYLEIRQSLRAGCTEFPLRGFLNLAVEAAGGAAVTFNMDVELEFWTRLCSMEPLPGIRDVLAELRQRGIKTGVVSNSMFSRYIFRHELERNGLLSAFQFVISSADYGLQKPHPMIFRAALRLADCEPHEAWYVGDNFEKDIAGATGVGMHAVWLSREKPPRPLAMNYSQIAGWHEFLRLLDDVDGLI